MKQCGPAQPSQQALMTLGSLPCTTLTLQLGAQNLAAALQLKQTVQASGMDSLNGCWTSDSSWQLLAMEDSGGCPLLSLTPCSEGPAGPLLITWRRFYSPLRLLAA